MVDRLSGETLIEFKHKAGPGGKYFPMLVITKGDAVIETALSLHGFKYVEDSQKVLDATKVILASMIEEDDGTEM